MNDVAIADCTRTLNVDTSLHNNRRVTAKCANEKMAGSPVALSLARSAFYLPTCHLISLKAFSVIYKEYILFDGFHRPGSSMASKTK